MNMYISVFLLAGVISLIGYLWLVFVGFKRNVAWGLLVLLLSPITAIVFSLMHWYEAHKAFLVYIISFVLCAASAVFITGDVGVGNMQQIATKLHNGQLPPAKAYQLIVKALGHPGSTDLFATATTTVPADANPVQVEPELAKPLPTKVAMVKEQAQLKDDAKKAPVGESKTVTAPSVAAADQVKTKPAAAATTQETKTTATQVAKDPAPKATVDTKKPQAKPPTPMPSINTVPTDPLAQKPKKPEPNTVRVRMDKMSHYVGHYFILTLKNGTEQRGLLRQVRNSDLILDRKLYGGNIQYKVSKSQVKTIHMLTRLPDER